MTERRSIPRPDADEYPAFYAGYLATLGEADPLAVLRRQPRALRAALVDLREEEALHRYALGKWSVKEVVGHLTDTERVFAYRMLRVARGDRTPLAGFDEDAFVAASGADDRAMRSLLAEFEAVRAATLALLEGLPHEAWERRGQANGGPVSTRALAHIVAGHAQHHLRLLGERYGLEVPVPDDASA